MGVTYVRAGERDVGRAAASARRLSEEHLLLAATWLVGVIAIGLACGGRLQSSTAESPPRATLINLNTVDDAAVLEQALARVFDASSDRRFAATHLLTAIRAMRHDDRRIPNVGELTARVPVDAIQRAPGLTVYGSRLARAQEDSTARRRAAPSTVPLLTASDLAALKPVLVVRTRGEFGRQLAIWVGVYFAAIWLLALFWFLRGVRGDGVLLAAAHFLTAIAFWPLAARPDPLRDTMLFASCA